MNFLRHIIFVEQFADTILKRFPLCKTYENCPSRFTTKSHFEPSFIITSNYDNVKCFLVTFVCKYL